MFFVIYFRLSLDEFSTALKLFKDDMTSKEIKHLFKCIDVDNNKVISFTEFLAGKSIYCYII